MLRRLIRIHVPKLHQPCLDLGHERIIIPLRQFLESGHIDRAVGYGRICDSGLAFAPGLYFRRIERLCIRYVRRGQRIISAVFAPRSFHDIRRIRRRVGHGGNAPRFGCVCVCRCRRSARQRQRKHDDKHQRGRDRADADPNRFDRKTHERPIQAAEAKIQSAARRLGGESCRPFDLLPRTAELTHRGFFHMYFLQKEILPLELVGMRGVRRSCGRKDTPATFFCIIAVNCGETMNKP